jgi:hypothetical protein
MVLLHLYKIQQKAIIHPMQWQQILRFYVTKNFCASLNSIILDVLNLNVVFIMEINNSTMIIFPNPAADKISIEIIDSKDVFFQIFNSLGVCVFESNLHETKIDFDICFLSSRIYTLQLSNQGGIS